MATLALAGILGPIVFTGLVIVQGLLQPDYSHLGMPISALATWPYGWIQNVNFYVFGLLMTGYAIGLHLGVRPSRGGAIGLTLLVVSGVGLVVAGIFPWSKVDGTFIVPIGHVVGAVMSFVGAGTGLIVMSRRMAGDAKWRGIASCALACGITIVVLFVAMGPLAVPDNAPLHAWAGLLQRFVPAVWFPCTIALGVRLLRVTRWAGSPV